MSVQIAEITRNETGERARLLRIAPHYAASPELLAQVDEFVAGGARNPGMARVLIQARDIVEKVLRARALPS